MPVHFLQHKTTSHPSRQNSTNVNPTLVRTMLVSRLNFETFDPHRSVKVNGNNSSHFKNSNETCFMKKPTNALRNFIGCLLTTPTCFGRLLRPSSGCTVLKIKIKSCVCVCVTNQSEIWIYIMIQNSKMLDTTMTKLSKLYVCSLDWVPAYRTSTAGDFRSTNSTF